MKARQSNLQHLLIDEEISRPPSFTMQFPNKEKLLEFAESMPEETLRMGIEVI